MSTKRNTDRLALSALCLGIVNLLPSPAWADNPIVQTNFTADPAPMVHDGRLYLYTSHDEDVTVDNFYTMIDWRLYSTKDMVNWTDHGSPAGLHTFSWSTDSAWAPQGIARNGQYYLYVPLNNNTGARIGVAVSDNVVGPYMDPLGKELAASGSGNIDPTVFIDDDDQAYMYWGNGTLRYVRLNEDMISYSGPVTNVDLPGFTEGPWLYKRESLYYMIYAGHMGGGNEKISYATSDSPTGPWTVRGDVMAAGQIFTNHPGIVDYQGRSYFFYHNGDLSGGDGFKRSVCVEEFTYGPDGSIPEITMTKQGPDPIATLNPFEQVEAETIANSSGLKTEDCDDSGGGLNVTAISNGDYIKVKNVDFVDGATSFAARVASANGSAAIELRLDSETGLLLGTCDVSGASSWTTVTCPVSGGSGTHDLFLRFSGDGDELFKFNWWKFDGPTMPTSTGGTGGMTSTGGMDSTVDGTGASVGGAGGGASTNGGTSNDTAVSTTGSGPDTSGSLTSSSNGFGGGVGTTATGTTTGSTASVTGTQPDQTSTTGQSGADTGSCTCRAGAGAASNGASKGLWLIASALLLWHRRR